MTDKEKDILKNLVGEFAKSQIDNLVENLENYIHPDLSMFVPIYRYCDYAVSANHTHPSYSFIYTIKQNSRFIVDGKSISNPLGNQSFVCAFSPDIKHQEIIEEGFSNYIAVFINKEYFDHALKNYGIDSGRHLLGEFFPADENILYLLKLLMLEYNTNQDQHTQVIDSLNTLITHQFIRLISQNQSETSTLKASGKIELAIAYMYENIAEKLTINDISSYVNTSASHFTKIFKEYTSKTPIEYLTNIRLKKAKRLLKSSDKNLTEIAFDCGFASSSYFSHSFIEAVKLTPSEYRKKFQVQVNIDNNE